MRKLKALPSAPDVPFKSTLQLHPYSSHSTSDPELPCSLYNTQQCECRIDNKAVFTTLQRIEKTLNDVLTFVKKACSSNRGANIDTLSEEMVPISNEPCICIKDINDLEEKLKEKCIQVMRK